LAPSSNAARFGGEARVVVLRGESFAGEEGVGLLGEEDLAGDDGASFAFTGDFPGDLGDGELGGEDGGAAGGDLSGAISPLFWMLGVPSISSGSSAKLYYTWKLGWSDNCGQASFHHKTLGMIEWQYTYPIPFTVGIHMDNLGRRDRRITTIPLPLDGAFIHHPCCTAQVRWVYIDHLRSNAHITFYCWRTGSSSD